jgi:hypothetical protein
MRGLLCAWCKWIHERFEADRALLFLTTFLFYTVDCTRPSTSTAAVFTH